MNIFYFTLFVVLIMVGYIYLCTSKSYAVVNNTSYKNSKYIFNSSSVYLFAIILVFSLLASTRLSFFDTDSYRNLFDLIKRSSFQESLKMYDFEPGFCVLTKLISLLTTDYHTYFFLFPFVNSLLIIKGLEELDLNPVKGLLIYYSTIGIYYNLIVLRQGIAISLLFLAYTYFVKDKRAVAIISVALAFVFHKSSIFIVLIFFLCRIIKMKRQTLLIVSVISLIIYSFGLTNISVLGTLNNLFAYLPSAFNKYYYYFRDFVETANFSLFYFGVFCFNYLFLLINKERDMTYIKYIVVGYFVFSLFSGLPVTVRIVHFFNLFYMFIFMEKGKHQNFYFVIFTIVHFVFYFRFILNETVLFF